ncbi:hypothetical protein HTZ77_31895 [Nonomuraea sp. SMC257]|uniref:Secreted protein n=1 Tax=Nonomuraea montanisoli TaxID=2741721 RepID=A0A7Y6M5N0_9ACTN|nr:hypothetical protein [Nonomuraea montanisoli]NUW35988.1 hypothetical protein [Nonomuraea montanisoli]
MLRRLLVTAALAGSVLAVPVATALPASAAVPSSVAAHACTYQRDGNVWRCITPGAFCPKAARDRYGYAKATNRRYKCLDKNDDPYWRWRRA